MTSSVLLCYNTSMKNKAIKNLIILGTIIFSFNFAHSVSAFNSSFYSVDSDNSQDSYQSADYSSGRGYSGEQGTSTGTPVVNNYYYTTSAGSATSTSDSTTTKTPSTATSTVTSTLDKNGDGINDNLLGASAANGLTALSLRGSGGFMPTSIWQWILVAVLILIIIVLIRTVTNSRPRVSLHHDSSVHSH